VLTSVTVKAFPSSVFATAIVQASSSIEDSEAFWNVLTNMLSQFPALNDQGVAGYNNIAPNITIPELNITTPINGFSGLFLLPLVHPSNTTDSFAAAINDFVSKATVGYPQAVSLVTFTTYQNFFDYYKDGNGPLSGGDDVMLGSRLLDGKALTSNITALKQAIKLATPSAQITQANLVGGKNVWNAKPRGGSNAVNPAWRKAYVHASMHIVLPPHRA
jgi:hypothetical protein